MDCLNLLIPRRPRNVEKFTKAPLFLDSMKSLDLPLDPQHFINSMKVAKRKSPSVKCLFVSLNILTMSEIYRSLVEGNQAMFCCTIMLATLHLTPGGTVQHCSY